MEIPNCSVPQSSGPPAAPSATAPPPSVCLGELRETSAHDTSHALHKSLHVLLLWLHPRNQWCQLKISRLCLWASRRLGMRYGCSESYSRDILTTSLPPSLPRVQPYYLRWPSDPPRPLLLCPQVCLPSLFSLLMLIPLVYPLQWDVLPFISQPQRVQRTVRMTSDCPSKPGHLLE